MWSFEKYLLKTQTRQTAKQTNKYIFKLRKKIQPWFCSHSNPQFIITVLFCEIHKPKISCSTFRKRKGEVHLLYKTNTFSSLFSNILYPWYKQLRVVTPHWLWIHLFPDVSTISKNQTHPLHDSIFHLFPCILPAPCSFPWSTLLGGCSAALSPALLLLCSSTTNKRALQG